jgi:hypothetical protein
MSRPILFQVRVFDNNDPLMLGRIRGTLLTDNYEDIVKSFDDPPFVEAKDAWTERDPFIFNPLLPYFIYQVPKINELVQIMYVNRDFKYQNQYYVQNAFYSPTSSYFQYEQGGNKFTGTGLQIANPVELRIKTLKDELPPEGISAYTQNAAVTYGVFPEAGDNALLGRGSADLIVKQDEVLLRAGKFTSSLLSPNVPPTGNVNRGFLQISKFASEKFFNEPKTQLNLNEKVLPVKYLIEWLILNPENKQEKLCGSVYLYQLKANISTNSKNVTVDSEIDEGLKKLVFKSDFNSLSKSETINFINGFIKTCNDKNVTKEGQRLFPDNGIKFPIFYRPSKITYEVLTPTTSSSGFNFTPSAPCPTGPSGTGVEIANVTDIFNKVKLLPALKKGGYGLIYKKDTVGTPMESEFVTVEQPAYTPFPVTYAALGADTVYLLSHNSSIPGKGKINLNNTLYGITASKFGDEITPKTSSMVRGEELLELINLIVRFLITHTHAYPGLPPVPVTQDGSNVSNILTEMQNAATKILNENIRIN